MSPRGIVIARALPSLLLAVLATACSSTASHNAARGTNPPPASPTTTPYNPITACANKIDYWLATDFFQGQPDRGDYQEMGLSSEEDLALRNLERDLGQTIKTFPAPKPADLGRREISACETAGAGGTQTGNWP